MTAYVHGETDPREVARLEKQAFFVAPLSLRNFEASPGERVLDLATGVGAMAGRIAALYPGVRLFGVDLSSAQLAAARVNHPIAAYGQADAAALPFGDSTFDKVHCSWLLEHVSNPLSILREVRRVLKPGGYCQFMEVDNHTFRIRPQSDTVARVMEALNRAQVEGGGDPFVGPKLEGFFRQAGFAEVDVHRSELVGNADDPPFFHAFIEEFAEIFEGLDETLPTMTSEAHQAASALRDLPRVPDSEIYYCGYVVRGTR